MSDKLMPFHIKPSEGRRVDAFGDSILFKLTGENTEGRFVLGLSSTPPGFGPPLHRHGNEDEVFIVLTGVYEFTTEDGVFNAEPGDVVFAPKGSIHTFKNVSDVLATTWLMTTPSGFDSFFTKCGEEFATGAPDMGRVMKICADHQLEILAAP